MKPHGEFQKPERVEPQLCSDRTSQRRKTLYSSWWEIRYLIIAFAYTRWSKQMSLFRKSSSFSGWPITNKQFHFLAATTSTLSATINDRWWSKSPNLPRTSCNHPISDMHCWTQKSQLNKSEGSPFSTYYVTTNHHIKYSLATMKVLTGFKTSFVHCFLSVRFNMSHAIKQQKQNRRG